jgi:dipeptidyl-peptidase 4
MKKIIIVFLLISSQIYAQTKLLTMEEAVLGQRGKLAPQRLNGLTWVSGAAEFSYTKPDPNASEKEILIKGDINNNQKTILSIDDFNSILKTIDLSEQKRFPAIKWLSPTTFKCTIAQKLIQIDIDKKEATVIAALSDNSSNQDIHPVTKNIAFTIENRLLLNISGKSTRVIHDGDYGLVNGQAVHRNEFGINKGIFWNNSGSALAYYHMNETMVTDYPILDNTSTPAKATNIKYPMAGDKSHEVSVYIYNVATNQKLVLNTGDPKDQYLTNIAWSPDDKHVYIAHVNREQNHMKLNKYDAHFGNLIETVFEEKNEKYVEPENPVLFVSGNSNQFVWQSERDGFNHLYLYDIHGKLIKQLTKGNWIVTQVHGFTKNGEKLYFTATKESYIERHLYSVDLASNEIKKLTEGEGTHTCDLNIEAGYFIDNYSSVNIPRNISIYTLEGKKQVELLKAPNPLAEYNMPKMELVKLKNDMGPELQGRIIYPLNFDKKKKYPLILYVYGGPHLQLINNTWLGGADMWMYLMAQQGYIVWSLDNRGSANRGFDFESAVHRQLGKMEMQDQMTGLQYVKNLGIVDEKRIGVHGWSFGGFMTTTLMTKQPDVFKVGVGGGPVIDWRMYEVMYTERYMDTPQENPEGYKENNLLNHIDKLKGKLMLIHGTADDVVLWQHSINYVQKCVENGKQLDYFMYPGHLHNVMGKDRVHLMQKVTDYFNDFLK